MSLAPPHFLSRRRLLGLSLAALAGGCARPTKTADGRTIIRYMAWGNPEQLEVERTTIAEFEKENPHVSIQLFMVPSSAYQDKLQLMLASRTAPDVMRVDHYIFPALVRKDYFLPLDEFIAREPRGFLADFVPTALDECRWQGKLYALSVLFGSLIIYYNVDAFQKAGLPSPYEVNKSGKWTWDKFVETAIALTKREKNGRVAQYGTNMTTFPQYASVVWNNGGDFMNRDLSRFTLGDDPQGIEGVQQYADLRWKWKCAPTPADNALSPFTFESGKIAMVTDWHGVSPRFRRNVKDFAWDIAPTPSGPNGNASVIKGNQLVISRETTEPELAWEFVKFMTSRENELRICGKLRRSVPTRYSVQNDPAYLESGDTLPHHTDVFLEGVQRGRPLPINARYQEWTVTYNAATDSYFNSNEGTAKQACREATDRINTLLAGEEGF